MRAGLSLVSVLIVLMFLVIPVYAAGPSPSSAKYGLMQGRFVSGNVPDEPNQVYAGTWITFNYDWTTVSYPDRTVGWLFAVDFLKNAKFDARLDGKPIDLTPFVLPPARCEDLGWTEAEGFTCYAVSFTYVSRPLPVGDHTVELVITFTGTLNTDGWTGTGGKLGGAPLAVYGDVWTGGVETFEVV